MQTESIKLKDIQGEDCRSLFDWRNDPLIQRNSFNSKPFSYADHQEWFSTKMASSATTFFMAYTGSHKIGVIRFDENEGEFKVSVMLNPKFIGKGFGHRLIEQGVKELNKYKNIEKNIIAEIKEDNIASIRAFEKSGFQKDGQVYVFRS